MKNWHVHLVWALVTVVVAAAVGRAVQSNRPSSDGDSNSERLSKADARIQKLELKIKELQETLARRDRGSSPSAPVAITERRKSDRSDKPPKSVSPPGDLIGALLESDSPEDWSEALLMISALPDRAGRVKVLRKIFDDGNKKLQLKALSLLPELGGVEASEMALELLKKGGPPWLRQRAASALIEIADPSTMPTLREAYADGDGKTRVFAARALADLGDVGPQNEIYNQALQDLSSPDGGLRERAVKRLGQVGGPSAIPYLGQSLGDPDSKVRRVAVKALGDSGLLEAIVVLEPALNDSDESIREQAARAIESLRNPELEGTKGPGKSKGKKKKK